MTAWRHGKPSAGWCGCLCILAALTGCASYSRSFDVIERDLAVQQYDAALLNIEQQSTTKNDRILYLLNKGMVQRMKRDFANSNHTLEAAKTEMERLYAASVSENTVSFLVNDAMVSYAGDDYEQVLVHLYMALNYLELGQADEARVEALQVEVKLREIGEKIPDTQFTEDAFSRYLTGLIYEDQGEWSDALIAYRKAYEAYRKHQKNEGLAVPHMLKNDLLRLAQRQGLTEEVAQYQKEFGMAPPSMNTGLRGELIFILNNGLAPIKREQAVTLLDPFSGVMTRIALPYYESRYNNVVAARITASGKQASSELMEDIDAIARQSLDARLPAITARALARAVAKTTASRAAQRGATNRGDNNDAPLDVLGAFAVQVAAIATERADTRSWLTLPANIQLARLSLPPGSYTVTVELLGLDGYVVARNEYSGVTITQAHKTYLTQHWIAAQLSGEGRAR